MIRPVNQQRCPNTSKLSANQITYQRCLLLRGQAKNKTGTGGGAFYSPVLSLNSKSVIENIKISPSYSDVISGGMRWRHISLNSENW